MAALSLLTDTILMDTVMDTLMDTGAQPVSAPMTASIPLIMAVLAVWAALIAALFGLTHRASRWLASAFLIAGLSTPLALSIATGRIADAAPKADMAVAQAGLVAGGPSEIRVADIDVAHLDALTGRTAASGTGCSEDEQAGKGTIVSGKVILQAVPAAVPAPPAPEPPEPPKPPLPPEGHAAPSAPVSPAPHGLTTRLLRLPGGVILLETVPSQDASPDTSPHDTAPHGTQNPAAIRSGRGSMGGNDVVLAPALGSEVRLQIESRLSLRSCATGHRHEAWITPRFETVPAGRTRL